MHLAGILDKLIAAEFNENLPSPDEAELNATEDLILYDDMVAGAEGKPMQSETLFSFKRSVELLAGMVDKIPTDGFQQNRLRKALREVGEVIDDILRSVSHYSW